MLLYLIYVQYLVDPLVPYSTIMRAYNYVVVLFTMLFSTFVYNNIYHILSQCWLNSKLYLQVWTSHFESFHKVPVVNILYPKEFSIPGFHSFPPSAWQ